METKTVVGPDLKLTAGLLSLAYLGDLLLTMLGSRFVVGFHELNPFVGYHVNTDAWLVPVMFKLLGLALVWYGVRILGNSTWRGYYAWLLGGAAILYLMLDLYQLVMLL